MRAGEKVICVNDTVDPKVNMSLFPNWVKQGESYIVRRLEGSLTGERRVLLEEVKNPSAYFPELGGNTEPGFAAKRFVPYEDFILGNYVEEEIETEALA